MDLETLKGKTIDDATFDELSKFVGGLVQQRDAAKNESINGRKGKDAKITELAARIEAMAERLGVDPDADLSTLPDAKGQAEAAKQWETKYSRLQRDLDGKSKAFDELVGKITTERRARTIAQAVSKHQFVDSEDASVLIGSRVVQEGEEFLFKAEGDKLIPVDEGVAWLAKTKPHLVKPAGGGGGSGFKGVPAGSGGAKQMTKAQFDALKPVERAKAMADGYTLTDV